jgi:D-psicose/D-tagatose/L-ribulose 3-epimerase
VTIAVEVVNRFESNLLNTAAQAIRFVDAVGEDNVGIHLDTFHMHIEEPDAAAAIRACGPRLRYFHVNENHRGYLDAGSIDFAPVFRALVNAQYGGVVAFESPRPSRRTRWSTSSLLWWATRRTGMTLGRYSGGPLLEQARRCVEAVKLP